VGICFDLGSGICYGNRQAKIAHHRQIDDVVPDESSLLGTDSGLAQNFFKRGQLVLNPLVDIFEL